jgi:O-antigen ligase
MVSAARAVDRSLPVAFVAAAVVLLAVAIAGELWPAALAMAGAPLVAALLLQSPATGLLAWLAASPIFAPLPSLAGAALPAVTVDRLLFAGVLGVAALRWIRRRGSPLPESAAGRAMLLFVALCASSALVAGGSGSELADGGLGRDLSFLALQFALPFAAFLLARDLISAPAHALALLWSLAGVGVVVCALGMLSYYGGVHPLRLRNEEIHLDRLTGGLGSAVNFGLVVGISALAGAVLASRTHGMLRAGLCCALALFAFALVQSKTRGVWLGVAAGFALVAWYAPAWRRPLVALAGAGALSIALAAPWLPNDLRERTTTNEPVFNRMALAATALSMASDHPWFGLGFGRYRFEDAKKQYYASFGGVSPWHASRPSVPHNLFLLLLVCVGAVGLACWTAVIVLAWRSARVCWCAHAAEPAGALALVAIGSTALYLTNGLFSDLIGSEPAAQAVFALLGAAEGMAGAAPVQEV